MPDQPLSQKQQTPRLDLSFRPRKSDPGEWAYDHRVGLCVTVIVYLVLAIVFVTAKIVIQKNKQVDVFYIETTNEIPVAPEITPEEMLRTQGQSDDFSGIRNRISNENAESGEGGRGGAAGSGGGASSASGRNVLSSQFGEEVAGTQAQMDANRRAYEQGLAEEAAIRNRNSGSNTAGSSITGGAGDAKMAGKVMVSFSLANPVRHSVDLFNPGYQCRGGGEIIVGITVNKSGKVITASPEKASSSVDDCMVETAVNAALRSRFNADGSAPERQKGTITYVFIPQ